MTEALPFTDDDASNDLLHDDPFALLIGMVLYQQVPVETAFAGPARLRERIGGLDPSQIANTDPDELEAAFREKPAIHRFPGNMSKRVQAVSSHITEVYNGDTTGLWADVPDANTLMTRLKAMPGFGDYKARVYLAVLARHFDVRPEGFERHMPDWPNISEIEQPEDRADLKRRKKAWKASRS